MSALPILYVEDDDNDVLFMRMGANKAKLPNRIVVVTSGGEALDYLTGKDRFANREEWPLPGLVLLDLNIPGLSGFEVLRWIRQQQKFRSLPVVLFTSSDTDTDKEKARQLGANDYIAKPSNMTTLPHLLKDLTRRWLCSEPGAAAVSN